MTETSHGLQNVIMELQQDLNAHQKELSSKTKKLVQMENIVSSMRIELLNKNKVIDELKISSKLQSDNHTDAMYLQIEEYKNQIHSKESKKQQIKSDYNVLQREYNQVKNQYNTLSFKSNQQQQEYNLRLSRLELNYKNKIQSIQQIHSNEIQQYKNKIETIKQQSYISNNAETENIKNSLKELKETHERIENDLNTQIEELKEQMNKREKEKEQLIEELNQLSDNYKKYAQNEIQKLNQKLQRYANGDVEIVLSIEINDEYIRNKPPPKKPAPPKPLDVNNKHSRQSSNASSTHSNNGFVSLLSPISPITSLPSNNASNSNDKTLTLKNIKSNPEFWSTDHSNPNGAHHKPYLSQGSMPSIDSNDDNEVDNEVDNDSSNDDTDSKDSKSDDSYNNNNVIRLPKNILTESKSANINNGHDNSNEDKLGKLTINNGYVSRRRPNISHIKTSKSVSSLPNMKSLSSLSSLSSLPSKPRTPTFYVVRQMLSDKNGKNNDRDKDRDKSYNAIIAQRYKSNNNYNNNIHNTKYTDSALGFIKNGVVSMWGSTPKSAQTPKPKPSRPRYLSSAHSVSGFPSTSWNGIKRNKRRHSNISSISSYGELYSDNLSMTSSTGYDGIKNKNGTASSVKLAPHDALSNKSLELQRKMLMQANTRLAEDLKNEKKHLMIVREKAHRKYKQLQIQMQTEQRLSRLKEQKTQTKLDKTIKELKSNEITVSKLRKEFAALQADYNMRIDNGELQNPRQQPQNNINEQFILKIQSLETNNKSLIVQCDKYRSELSRLKQTILSCDETMKQQQKQILTLNSAVSELRKLNGFSGGGTSSSEQLLQKQIRLLKSQRRMLIQELKDLRQQNDKLKNIIVSGSAPGSVLHQYTNATQ